MTATTFPRKLAFAVVTTAQTHSPVQKVSQTVLQALLWVRKIEERSSRNRLEILIFSTVVLY